MTPGLTLGQCTAILLLKLRLWRNMLSPSKILSLIVGISLFCIGVLAAAGGAIGMFFLGTTVLAEERPYIVLATMDALITLFVLGWAWSSLLELKRSDHIDFRKMLYFPISMKALFALNFCGSLFSLALLLLLPSAAGLIAGLVHAGQPQALWLAPIALLFFLMIAAWSYYFHGIIATWIQNKKRRRLLMTLLPMAFVLLAQAPWLLMNTMDPENIVQAIRTALDTPHNQRTLLIASAAIPFGWLPLSVWAITTHEFAAALAIFFAMLLMTTIGWILGYRCTVRHYLGTPALASTPKTNTTPTQPHTPATARTLPWLNDDTAALTRAMFLGYARHPHIRLQLIMPICMGIIFGLYFMNAREETSAAAALSWGPAVLLVWPFMNFAHFLFNLFGTDRNAFRGLILLPMRRDRYLLCKNLALFPFVGGLALVLVLLGAILLQPSPVLVTVSLLQVFQLYLLCCTAGNFISLWFPYHISRDLMRRQRNQGLMFLVGLLTMATLALVTLPTAACLYLDTIAAEYWNYQGPSLALLASLTLLALTIALYTLTLRHAGDLLLTREQRILEILAHDRE